MIVAIPRCVFGIASGTDDQFALVRDEIPVNKRMRNV
jgi:hypothetical protein